MVKLLGKNRENLDIGLSHDILFETPKVQATQVKVNKRVYIKLKGFYTEMET